MTDLRRSNDIATRHFNDHMDLRKAEDGELFLVPNFKPVFGNETVVKDLLVTADFQRRAFRTRKGQADLNRQVLQQLNCLLKPTACEAENKDDSE